MSRKKRPRTGEPAKASRPAVGPKPTTCVASAAEGPPSDWPNLAAPAQRAGARRVPFKNGS